MATPTADTYNVAAGVRAVAGGRAAILQAPAWTAGMTVGVPYKVAGTTLDLSLADTNVAQDNSAYAVNNLGGRNFRGHMDEWCGGVMATGMGAAGSLLTWGGGHAGYAGNDVHRWDVATRTWSQLTTPFVGTFASASEFGEESDGTPCMYHTRNTLVYDSRRHAFVTLMSIPSYQSETSAAFTLPHILDLYSLEWRRGNDEQTSRAVGYEYGATYDPVRDRIWYANGFVAGATANALGWYNPADDTWGDGTTRGDNMNTSRTAYIKYAAEHDAVIGAIFEGGGPLVRALDPNNPGNRYTSITVTGAPSVSFEVGFDYGANTNAMYLIGRNGGQIYKLQLPDPGTFAALVGATWAWSSFGTALPIDGDTGAYTFGRFQVVSYPSGIDLAIHVQRVNAPVYAMRLN